MHEFRIEKMLRLNLGCLTVKRSVWSTHSAAKVANHAVSRSNGRAGNDNDEPDWLKRLDVHRQNESKPVSFKYANRV